MIISCFLAVIPFAVYYMVFLMFFSICFVILEMDVDEETEEAQGLNYFAKIVLQTFRTAIGELANPAITRLLRKEPSIFRTINISLIWIIWLCQVILMLIVMLNFLVSVITDNYGRVQQL